MNCSLMIWARRVRIARPLTSSERLVLIYLAESAINGTCSPSLDVIAADNELSVSTARSATRALAEVGLIGIDMKAGRITYSLNAQTPLQKLHPYKNYTPTKITPQNPGIPTCARAVEDNLLSSKTLVVTETLTGKNLSPPPSLEIRVEASTVPNRLAIEKPIADDDLFSENPRTPSTLPNPRTNGAQTQEMRIDALFETWWKHYPRKLCKKNARIEYAKAVRKLDSANLLDALRRYPFNPDIGFIVYPERWLKNERWNDDYAALAAALRKAADREAEQRDRAKPRINSMYLATA